MPIKAVPNWVVAVGVVVTIGAGGELSELAKKGLTQNPLLHSYLHQLNQARYQTESQKGQLFPTFSAQLYAGRSKYQYDYPTEIVKYNQVTKGYTLSLSMPLFNKQIYDSIEEGKKREEYYRLQVTQFKQQLIEKIGESYLGVVGVREQLRLLEEELELLRQLKEGAYLKFKAHLIGEVEYREAVAKYWEKRGEVERYRSKLKSQIAQLKYWAGIGGGLQVRGVQFNSGALLSLPLPSQFTGAHSPELQIAKINMEVAKAQWKQARDKLWPSLNLRGSYSDTKTTDSITKRKDYELAVYLNIPLYNRADRKQVEGVREGYLSYRARYLDKKRELTAQFEGLLEELKGLKTQLQALEKGVLAGALNLKKGEESYKNRLISIFDLYSAIESYYSTKLQLIDTQRQLLQNYLQLLQLQGELSLDKIGEIEKLYLKTN